MNPFFTGITKASCNSTCRYILVAVLLLSLIVISSVQRENFPGLLWAFAAAFAAYFVSLRARDGYSWKEIWMAALIFRLVFFFYTPQLSDDYLRFFWDGRLVALGENPYEKTPGSFSADDEIWNYHGADLTAMNSTQYYSVYPPMCQWIWAACDVLAGHRLSSAIMWLRIFTLVFEMATLFLLGSVLKRLGKPAQASIIYAWNPLVIVELTGNLHPECVMIFFLACVLYFLQRKRFLLAAAVLGLAISTKLVPLVLTPMLSRIVGWKKSLAAGAVVLVIVVIAFLPFLSLNLLSNTASSLDLYFQHFEFNAGLYYLVREVGYLIYGYNTIHWLGPILSLLAMLLILGVSLKWVRREQEVYPLLIWPFAIYLLSSTTVHPWYITTIVFFSVFTTFRFGIVWSFVVVLSYSHYMHLPVRENYLLIAMEYFLVFMALVYDVRKLKFGHRMRDATHA